MSEELRAKYSFLVMVMMCIAFGFFVATEWRSIEARYHALTGAGL